jgi:hypothetical protein
MPTETINFRLAKQPLIKEKIIVLEEANGSKAVIFPMYREKHDIEHAEVAKEGEVLELTGKWGTDKKTGKPQFYVDSAHSAKIAKEVTAVTAIAPVDINTGQPHKATVPKLKDIKAAMDKNFYPGPLFPGDPYAINPEVDFKESDKVKIFSIADRTFYTDAILVWEKGNNNMRNKMVLAGKLREEYLKQHDMQALFSIHELTEENEPYPENHRVAGLPTTF